MCSAHALGKAVSPVPENIGLVLARLIKIATLTLKVTTYESKIGFLLIEVFRRAFNPRIDGHLEAGGLFLFVWCFTKQMKQSFVIELTPSILFIL